MSRYYIYGLFRDNKPFYIGATKYPKRRSFQHRQKHGKDFELVVLDEIRSEFMLVRKPAAYFENYWREQFEQWGFSLKNKQTNKKVNINKYKFTLR